MLEHYADVEVVGEACDGEEALACTEKLKPNVVVMDIHMPKMNGIEATAQLKGRYPDITIIGLSVNGGEENQEAMKKAGATSLITKQAAVEQLYAVIQATYYRGANPH
jgi:DNA-binding NarL/FixJ family response regulator